MGPSQSTDYAEYPSYHFRAVRWATECISARTMISMRWDKDYESPDVEDRRSEGPPVEGGGGLGFLLPLAFRFGWKGILVALVIYGGLRLFAGGGMQHGVSQQRAGHDDARA